MVSVVSWGVRGGRGVHPNRVPYGSRAPGDPGNTTEPGLDDVDTDDNGRQPPSTAGAQRRTVVDVDEVDVDEVDDEVDVVVGPTVVVAAVVVGRAGVVVAGGAVEGEGAMTAWTGRGDGAGRTRK